MNGWTGKLIKVDLSSGKIEDFAVSEQLRRKYLGGRGLGVKLYSQLCPKPVEPFADENALIFLTGPLTGTAIPTAGRYQVISRSPLTGTIFDASSGGDFGAMLKRAGLDGLIITGRAPSPVYLQVGEGGVEIKKADDLWGLDTSKTREAVVAKAAKKVSVASIGPAGENRVFFAAIMNDKDRAAGRGGLGAVMGAKNLKAIAAGGNLEVSIHDPEGLEDLLEGIERAIDKNAVTGKSLQILGTPVLVNIINEHGMFPTRNFQRGVFNDAEGISGEKIAETILVKRSACHKCYIACGRSTRTPNDEGEGPEYETTWAFGAQCGVNDLNAVAEANYLCNRLGLDTITTGNTIGCAMELSEQGVFPHRLRWGDAGILKKLVEDIAYRRGVGEELALGSKKLAEKYGRPQLAMQVKGLEIPAYDPRGAQGQALAYATSNRGGCHMRAYLIAPEILGQPVFMDRFSTEGKAELVILLQDISAAVDSLVLCRFLQIALGISSFTEMLRRVTGLDFSDEELLAVGKRIYTLERWYNSQAGFGRKDDLLPRRFIEEKFTEGASRNRTVELDRMLDEYYRLRGWDQEGVPLAKTMKELAV